MRFTQSCAAMITIQLVILKELKNSIELSKAIKKLDGVNHTHRSVLSTTNHQDACKELGIKARKLIASCTTWWNSKYMSIKSSKSKMKSKHLQKQMKSLKGQMINGRQ